MVKSLAKLEDFNDISVNLITYFRIFKNIFIFITESDNYYNNNLLENIYKNIGLDSSNVIKFSYVFYYYTDKVSYYYYNYSLSINIINLIIILKIL
jgi:hypothetical protein